ncbi:hypothetical protein J3369_03015 [Alteromonas sp. NFXS44]|uniref:hypothetical protein n=1 Tax=Alteromonas sp. NFXS44 TaxID=2818435 RepID=UPI0032DFF722
MTIFITITNTNQWDEIVSSAPEDNVIEHLDIHSTAETKIVKEAVSLNDLSNCIDSFENLVILYESPESYLYRRIETNFGEGFVIENCLSYLNGLVSIFRNHREKIKLLNLDKIANSTEHEITALDGLHLPSSQTLQPAARDFRYLAAYYLVNEDESLSAAAELLEACSLPVYYFKNTAEILTKFSDYLIENEAERKLNKKFINDIKNNVVKLENENALLNSHLVDYKITSSARILELEASLSESLTEVKLLRIKNKEYYNNFTKQNSLLEKETTEVKRLTTLVDEFDLNEKGMKSKIFELEASNHELKIQQKRARNQLQESIFNFNAINRELKTVKESLYWRITSPARLCSTKLKRKDIQIGEALKRDIKLLYSTNFFDADWYLSVYPDVAEANIDPAEHYLLHGASEGRSPSSAFDGQWYLRTHKDVEVSGINPLIHYLMYGMGEKRTIKPKKDENRR